MILGKRSCQNRVVDRIGNYNFGIPCQYPRSFEKNKKINFKMLKLKTNVWASKKISNKKVVNYKL